MSWFDLVALVVVLLAVLDGARNGLAWAATETVLIVGAALAARALHGHAEPYLLKVADLGPDDLHGTSHIVVFIATGSLVVGTLILLHPASKRWRFRHDAWFGGVLGAGNGLFAALVLFSIAIWSHPREGVEESLAQSRIVPVLRAAAGGGLAGVFPEHLARRLTELERP